MKQAVAKAAVDQISDGMVLGLGSGSTAALMIEALGAKISAGDLKDKWFQGCTTVGISAGASTPDEIINDVIKEIKIISNSTKEEVVYDKRFV